MPCRFRPALRFALLLPALLGAAGLALPGAASAQTEFGCPRYVDAAPIADVNAPAGWSAAAQTTRRWLRGAEMYEGDPAANQRIRSLEDRSRGTIEWTIPPGSQAPTLVCQYHGTEVTLARVVPYGLRRCFTMQQRPDPMRRRSEDESPDWHRLRVVCR